MSERSEAVVRAIYDAWREGRSARDWIAEDLEYVNPADAVESGVKHGRQYLKGFRDVYDEVAVEPLEISAVGDEDVLVIGRLSGVARGSGAAVDTRQGYVWTVRDGVAVRFRWFREPEQAYRALGLSR